MSFWTNNSPSHTGASQERMRIDASGNVGIGTKSPGEKLDVSGNIKIVGNIQSNASDFKNQFGFFTSDEGAKANNSTAMGYRTKASGTNSTAMGYYTDASGSFSTAMGYCTKALGTYSTAMGYCTDASGSFSTAMGYDSSSNGLYSTAMGVQTTASGRNSTAMGRLSTASGRDSTAMCYHTTASGISSTAMGYDTTASGLSSTAMGYETDASGSYSTAMGFGTLALAPYSTAMGKFSYAGGTYSTAIGNKAYAGGTIGFAIGCSTSNTEAIATDMSNNNKLVVLNNGNVGIGTPAWHVLEEKLEVIGNIKCTQIFVQTIRDLIHLHCTGNIRVGGDYVAQGGSTPGGHLNYQIGYNQGYGHGTIGIAALKKTYTHKIEGSNYSANTADNYHVSIYSDGDMLCDGSYRSFSDKRIKKNIVELDDLESLNLLRKIEVKKYNYINTEKGLDDVYGFIAQQVDTVKKGIVTKGSNFIPNIMKYYTAEIDISNNEIIFTDLSGCTNISNSVGPSGEIIIRLEVKTQNKEEYNLLDLQLKKIIQNKYYLGLPPSYNFETEIFVYGIYVYDFHTIDKAKLFALNFSASQEIDRIQQEEKVKLGEQATKLGEQATKLGEQATKLGEQATKLGEQATKLGEQTTKLEIAEAKIESLETENISLKARLDAIEERLTNVQVFRM